VAVEGELKSGGGTNVVVGAGTTVVVVVVVATDELGGRPSRLLTALCIEEEDTEKEGCVVVGL